MTSMNGATPAEVAPGARYLVWPEGRIGYELAPVRSDRYQERPAAHKDAG
jgi:hypothetical protein